MWCIIYTTYHEHVNDSKHLKLIVTTDSRQPFILKITKFEELQLITYTFTDKLNQILHSFEIFE